MNIDDEKWEIGDRARRAYARDNGDDIIEANDGNTFWLRFDQFRISRERFELLYEGDVVGSLNLPNILALGGDITIDSRHNVQGLLKAYGR